MTTNLFPGVPAGADEYRLFTLKNASDMTVTISERGAALRSWRTPDRYGRMADVMLADPESPSSAGRPPLWHGCHADGGVALRLAQRGGADMRISYRLADDGRQVHLEGLHAQGTDWLVFFMDQLGLEA